MTFAKFHDEPWQTSHDAYSSSIFAMSPAPEYASSEVVLSSLYRHLGLDSAKERTVPQNGRDLERHVLRSRDRSNKPTNATLDANTFHLLLHSVLESPKLPNQSSKRFVQITPLVPQAAVFSGSARLAGNSWPAGALVRRMVWLGSPDSKAAREIWADLFNALSVSDNDDIFARFLQEEMQAWVPNPGWAAFDPEENTTLAPADRDKLDYPAKRFVRDLTSIIKSKHAMTRRQWTSLVEAIIRLAAVAHCMWLCDVHARIWNCFRLALDGGGPADEASAREALYPNNFQFLSYGDRALPGIKDRASSFLAARLGINAVLWAVSSKNIKIAPLSSAAEVAKTCAILREQSDALQELKVREILADLSERETRTLLCKKGIGSNIMEFARHVLGQRQAANPILRGYDQGFSLRRRGTSDRSPWVVGLGPVSVLALVHCALAGMTGPRSVRRLSQHLSSYGAKVDHNDIATNDLGHQLRMLGLVLDSPDAESGMLLVPPFPAVQDLRA